MMPIASLGAGAPRAVLWVLLLGAWACGSEAKRQLVLEEQSHYAVSDAFEVARLSSDGAGGALLVAQSSPDLVHIDARGEVIDSIGLEAATRILALSRSDGRVHEAVFEDSLGALWRFVVETGESARLQYPPSLLPLDATHDGQSWTVLALRTGPQLIPTTATQGADRTVLLRQVAPTDVLEVMSEFDEPFSKLISTQPGQFLLTRPLRPFGGALVDYEGDVLLAMSARDPNVPDATIEPSWQALQLLALDWGYLQVIVDRRSNLRALVRFDEGGRLVQETLLDAPLGLAMTDVAAREVWGARRVGGVELVKYRWRWVR